MTVKNTGHMIITSLFEVSIIVILSKWCYKSPRLLVTCQFICIKLLKSPITLSLLYEVKISAFVNRSSIALFSALVLEAFSEM